MKIFIATKNQKKLKELERILIPMGFEVLSQKDLDKNFPEPIEDGTTFEENAIIKAKDGLKNTGLISVADDSGICVDYLGGAPGIYSARYSGEHGDDESNNQKTYGFNYMCEGIYAGFHANNSNNITASYNFVIK